MNQFLHLISISIYQHNKLISLQRQNPTDQDISKILDLLKIFNLAQSVNLPTHTRGHILDWIIYRPDDKILVSSSVSNELTSDHFALLS